MTWQNQQSECAPSEDSDQPGHLPSLIRVFAVRFMGNWGPKLSSCGQRRLWSYWADAQADLSLRWVHSHFVGFVMRRLISFYQLETNASQNHAKMGVPVQTLWMVLSASVHRGGEVQNVPLVCIKVFFFFYFLTVYDNLHVFCLLLEWQNRNKDVIRDRHSCKLQHIQLKNKTLYCTFILHRKLKRIIDLFLISYIYWHSMVLG